MIKVNHETFNDGLLEYGSVTSTKNLKLEKTGSTYTKKGSLYFKQMDAREGDILLSSNMDFKLDLKVKTHKRNDLSSQDKVRINGVEYDIKYMDKDSNHLYLYMQKVGGVIAT